VIRSWRGERRIGPAPVHERLRFLIVSVTCAVIGASILTPLFIWIKLGWPPPVYPRVWTTVWCGSFALMMFGASESFWSLHTWRELAAMVAATIVVIIAAAMLAPPVLAQFAPPPPPERVIPISPVTP
jgi:hypothetical protein